MSAARLFLGGIVLAAGTLAAATYEVGPDKPYTTIGAAPWAELQPGDAVLIHWRPEPYREKWVICRQGAGQAPIVVRGVAGPEGQLPVIDGNGAVTARGLNYWNEPRGVIKIGGANVPADTMPRHIVVENLEIRSARPPYSFTNDGGQTENYAENAAAVYIEKGENIVIRNCVLHDSGNGLFIGTLRDTPTRDILIQSNYIHSNGNQGSFYEHNSYTAAVGITFQFNRYGPLRSGAGGNNLKDRSAGLVVRWNWIEGGNRQLDLVDAEDSPVIQNDPRYRTTEVYGNILVEPADEGNRQIVHYGGDSGTTSRYRKGTLVFVHNTIVSTRTDRTTFFRLSTNEESCDARNNVFYATLPGDTVSMLDAAGALRLAGNWIKPGWRGTFGELQNRIEDAGGMVQSEAPGFASELNRNYRPAAGSACVNRAVAAPLEIGFQYREHTGWEPRAADGAPDIGAFEYRPRLRDKAPEPRVSTPRGRRARR